MISAAVLVAGVSDTHDWIFRFRRNTSKLIWIYFSFAYASKFCSNVLIL